MSRASPFHLIYLFRFRCDKNAKIGDKLIYASTKDTIKKSFTGLLLEFKANDKGDLDYTTLSEEVEKKVQLRLLVSIHQNTTLELYNFYFWFCSPAVYFSDGNKYQLLPPILHLLSLIALMNLAVAGGHFVDRINFKKNELRYHPPSTTLLALIGASAFAFNKYPHKPYIFLKLNSSRLLLIPFKKSKYLRDSEMRSFCESGCHCKLKSRAAKNKRKKPIQITFAS